VKDHDSKAKPKVYGANYMIEGKIALTRIFYPT